MIPTRPDWQAIATELRQRYGSDDRVANELAKQGVCINRSLLVKLRRGPTLSPTFATGAALLNLYAIPKAPVRVRAERWPCRRQAT